LAAQSLFWSQTAVSTHLGAQTGAAQVPLVQTCDTQSEFAPHPAPKSQFGAQAGG